MHLLLAVLTVLPLFHVVSGEVYHLNSSQKSKCVPIVCDNGLGSIEIESKSADIIPVLIVPYSLIDPLAFLEPFQYNTVPTDRYISSTSEPKNPEVSVKVENFKYRLKAPSGQIFRNYNRIERLSSLKYYIQASPDVLRGETKILKKEFAESRQYCIYIGPHNDDIDITVIVKHSNGYLSGLSYKNFSCYIIGIPIMFTLVVTLFRNVIRKNLSDIPVVTRSALFFIILPELVVVLIRQVVHYILNSSREVGRFATTLDDLNDWLDRICLEAPKFFHLYFCMGYGIIYYHRPTGSLKELPKTKKHLARSLIIIYAVQLFWRLCFEEASTLLTVPDEAPIERKFPGFISTVKSVLKLAPFVIYLLLVIQYTKTREAMRAFPPYPSTAENYEDKNGKLTKSFKRSVIFILLWPIFDFIIGFLLPMGMFGTLERYELDRNLELMCSVVLYAATSEIIGRCIYIVSVYLMWVKNDVGITANRKKHLE